jgi:DNA polymerase-3 subunit delta
VFYVLHGDNTFSQSEELAKLVDRMGDPAMAGLNTTRLDGHRTSWDELVHHCNTIPFFSERRLVIVSGLLSRLKPNAKSKADRDFLDNLLELLPQLPDTTRLILLEEETIPSRHPVLRLARELPEGYEKAQNTPEGNALTRWVHQRVRQEGGQIDTDAAQMLCAFTNNDLHHLHQEVQKLVAYASGRAITRQDVQVLTPQAQEANIFQMVDALGRRDGKTASSIYHQLLSTGSHPLALLGMIARQFRLMIQVKELAPNLHTPRAIARELGQNPYPIGKILRQSANYSMAHLRTVYHKLLETDINIKTGQTGPTIAIDLFIAALSPTP